MPLIHRYEPGQRIRIDCRGEPLEVRVGGRPEQPTLSAPPHPEYRLRLVPGGYLIRLGPDLLRVRVEPKGRHVLLTWIGPAFAIAPPTWPGPRRRAPGPLAGFLWRAS